jgi:hypothetical protein
MKVIATAYKEKLITKIASITKARCDGAHLHRPHRPHRTIFAFMSLLRASPEAGESSTAAAWVGGQSGSAKDVGYFY